MKKAIWISPIIFIAILLLIACKKEKTSGDIEYKIIHWPVVKTLKVTNIDSTTAKLNGTVNGYGLSTIVIFEYGTTTTYSNIVTASESPVTQNGVTNVSADITGLTCGRTYHFRIKADNSKWIDFYSTDSTFTSGHIPSLKTTSISGIAATTAVSGGNIISDGCTDITLRGVCWSKTFNPTTSDPKTSDGSGSGEYVSNIIGLNAGMTYHIRAYATNSAGTAYGNDVSFSTLGQSPTSLTLPATNVSVANATLNGTVNANSLRTTVTFEYGTTTDYGSTATASQSPVTGNTITIVSENISGLALGTNYHFRVKAENSLGVSYGSDVLFSTLDGLPILTTTLVSDVTRTTAISGGNITDDGGAAVADRGVDIAITKFGLTGNHFLPPIFNSTHDGTGTGNFTSNLTGLQPGTTYYIRAYADNGLRRATGNIILFTTLPPPPPCYQVPIVATMAATNISSTGATLNGTVNANGSQTTVTFKFRIPGNIMLLDRWITIPALQSPITGNSIINVSADVSDLKTGVVYVFYVRATNSCGTIDGDEMSVKL